MGLDIYTYTAEQEAANNADDDSWVSSDDVPSKEFPGNINNRRYLRSSYNSGGFNSVVPEVTGHADLDYYGILAPLRDAADSEYSIKVDDPARILQARDNAVRCVIELEKVAENWVYRTTDVRAVSLRPDDTDGAMDQTKAHERALEAVLRHEQNPGPFGGEYTDAHGLFHVGEPLEVVAAQAGTARFGMGPCVYLTYRTKLHESYVESAKVLVEFCDELAELVEKDGRAYVHWSG